MDGLFQSNEFCILMLGVVGLLGLTFLTLIPLMAWEVLRHNFRRPRGAQRVMIHNLARVYLSVASVIALLVIGSDMTNAGARSFESAVIAGGSLTILLITMTEPITAIVQKLMMLAEPRTETLPTAVVLVFPEGRPELRRAA